MEKIERLWSQVDELKETQIRHDERMRQIQQGQVRAMEHFAKLETKFDELSSDITTGFQTVSARMDSLEEDTATATGYKKGQKDALKLWGSLFTILTFLAGVIMWWLSRGA